MIGKRVISSKAVSLPEVAEILGGAEELGFEQTKTLAHARKFAKLSKEKAEELITELMEIERVSREKAVKIADLLPKSVAEVKSIFAKEIYSMSDEEVAKIIEIVGKHVR